MYPPFNPPTTIGVVWGDMIYRYLYTSSLNYYDYYLYLITHPKFCSHMYGTTLVDTGSSFNG